MEWTRICRLASQPGVVWRLIIELAIAAAIVAVGVTVGWNGKAMAAMVTLSPGDNIQDAVNASPAGTTFVLRSGVYRNDSITLSASNNGDSFIGQAGAILDGAKVLTGWRQATIHGVNYWTTAGGTPQVTPVCPAPSPVPCCMSGYDGCVYIQDLYLGGVGYNNITTLAGVTG